MKSGAYDTWVSKGGSDNIFLGADIQTHESFAFSETLIQRQSPRAQPALVDMLGSGNSRLQDSMVNIGALIIN